MKRMILLILAAVLALAGCAAQEVPDPHPDWDPDWVRVMPDLGVENPEGFTLSEHNELATINGISYSTWSAGPERAVVNAQGQDATAYDAQIYILVKENKTPEEAQADVAEWLEMEQESYGAAADTPLTAAGQEFRVLPLTQGSQDNPYHHGRAALAVRGNLAIIVEYLCVENWTGNPEAELEAFLQGFHYGA